ncbi:MAG: hypothetical protein HQ508_03915 [Candidatus Marinimicrobia bacterium]|nr:hypothetical protein [Candidatus Neomarinimicrobiota bacterium]
MNIFILLVFLSSCEDEPFVNTDKSTFYDDMADITALNGFFYSTNYDRSGHAGSQIDLLKFESSGTAIFLSDSYSLDLNGQGYFAITNDGSNLYLQSRDTQLIMKYSGVGEQGFLGYDDISTSWLPAGLAYNPDNDSLIALYRNSQDLNEFRLRTLSKNLLGESSRDARFQLGFIDPVYHGLYALEYHDSLFFLLGVDTTHQDLLLTLDYNFSIVSKDTLSDSTVVGLAFKENGLYLSYRDRRIELFVTL